MEIEEVAKSYARGSTYIFAGRTISFLISFVGVAIIARLLAREYGSSEPFGWLQVLLFLPQLTLLLGDLGMSYGLTNKCAKLFVNKDYEGIAEYFWSWTFFYFLLNLVYASIALFLGGWLLTYLYSKPEVTPFVYLVAIGMICNYLMGIGQAIAIILDKAWVLSLSLIMYSLTQALFAPLALILGFKFYGLAFVYFIATPSAASIPGLLLLFRRLPLRKPSLEKVKEMVKFGFPVAASFYTTIPGARAYEILISRFATSAQLGYYSVAQRLSPIVDNLLYSIGTLMLVNYSKLNKNQELSIAVNFTIKIVSFFIAPIAIFAALFSKQLIIALFGPYYVEGWFYLTLLAIAWLNVCLGGYAIGNAMIAQGYNKDFFRFVTISSIVGLILNLILIPLFSITGALISSIIYGYPSYILSLKFLKEKMNITIRFNEIIKIIVSALFSVLPSYFLWYVITSIIELSILQYYITLFLCIIISSGIYLITTKRLNLIKDSELRVIEEGLTSIPFAGNLIGFILGIYKKL